MDNREIQLRKDIVRIAREYINTPFVHQGRVKHHGIDCGGLPVCVLAEVGIIIQDEVGYSRIPNGTIEKVVLKHCIYTRNPIPADIYVFKFKRIPQHIAFVSDYGLIHAYPSAGKVVETTFDDVWRRRLVGAYQLKEVCNG